MEPTGLPYFLQSFDNLKAHFEEHFEPLTSQERGRQFLAFAQRVIPLTDEGSRFTSPEPAPKETHDGGVDLLTAENDAGETLRGQSKYKILAVEEFDNIISKFRNYEHRSRDQQTPLLPPDEGTASTNTFFIVTSSKLDGIVKRYRDSALASRQFYERLQSEGRLVLVDGQRILTLLQSLYRKTHIVPTDFELVATVGWLTVGTVRIGTILAHDLVDLYRQCGDSLFFENIRDFLGVTSGKKKAGEGRVTVNQDIIATIDEAPEKMLERNNGITFRAEAVEELGANRLRLRNAGIINGCQTTMCLVHHAVPDDSCLVLAKIVATSDAWKIAKSANYQNAVDRIDLDLARYLRPQTVSKAATDQGYGLVADSTSTAAAVLSTIYQNTVDYKEMRCLYLGLFSRKANNVFDNNYTEVRGDVLESLYGEQSNETLVFATLFAVLSASRKALEYCKSTFTDEPYSSWFKRFYRDDKTSYRTYLSLLAICGMLDVNIEDRDADPKIEASRMQSLLSRIRTMLQNSPKEFDKFYLCGFNVLAEEAINAASGDLKAEVAQLMYSSLSGSSLQKLLIKLRMRMRTAEQLTKK
jgi:hypothetical protein